MSTILQANIHILLKITVLCIINANYWKCFHNMLYNIFSKCNIAFSPLLCNATFRFTSGKQFLQCSCAFSTHDLKTDPNTKALILEYLAKDWTTGAVQGKKIFKDLNVTWEKCINLALYIHYMRMMLLFIICNLFKWFRSLILFKMAGVEYLWSLLWPYLSKAW